MRVDHALSMSTGTIITSGDLPHRQVGSGKAKERFLQPVPIAIGKAVAIFHRGTVNELEHTIDKRSHTISLSLRSSVNQLRSL